MTLRPAYDGVALVLRSGIDRQSGPCTVRLRPTMRAASYFAQRDGFADLPRRVVDCHLGTIRDLITVAAIDRQEATAFLASMDMAPLRIVAATITAPILNLVAGFVPAPDDDASPASDGKPMPWPAVYRELYRKATGWLGWTPESAWNATPTEISEAVAGHIEKLKAIHGSTEGDSDKQPDAYTPEQMRKIEEKGCDPAFDREALRKLRAKIARKT